MPELPDVVVYLERLRPRVVGRSLEKIRPASPFLLRSVEPPLEHHRRPKSAPCKKSVISWTKFPRTADWWVKEDD